MCLRECMDYNANVYHSNLNKMSTFSRCRFDKVKYKLVYGAYTLNRFQKRTNQRDVISVSVPTHHLAIHNTDKCERKSKVIGKNHTENSGYQF